jgi:hypothetical protein
MLLKPSQLKHHVSAASRGRYALNSIALMPEGSLSTDGHSLLFVPYPDTDPKDAPKIDGVDAAAAPPKHVPFLLSTEDAAKVAAMAGKPKRFAPLATQLVQAQIDGDSLICGATDLSNAQTMRVRRLEGQFPEVSSVIPDYATAHTITINLDQLLRSLKALKGVTSDEVVTLRVIDDQSAIGLSCKDGTAMLVMPIQVDKPEEHVPCQLAKLRDDDPAVAAPADDDSDADDDPLQPFPEGELQEAQEVYDSLPPVPEPVTNSLPSHTPKPRRRRRKSAPVEAELAEIIGG